MHPCLLSNIKSIYGPWRNEHELLKLLMELVFLLFIMILFKYQDEIKKVIYFDKYQRKIDEFLTKKG